MPAVVWTNHHCCWYSGIHTHHWTVSGKTVQLFIRRLLENITSLFTSRWICNSQPVNFDLTHRSGAITKISTRGRRSVHVQVTVAQGLSLHGTAFVEFCVFSGWKVHAGRRGNTWRFCRTENISLFPLNRQDEQLQWSVERDHAQSDQKPRRSWKVRSRWLQCVYTISTCPCLLNKGKAFRYML